MSELNRLTGVGPKRLQALESAGIRTLRDLVWNLPRRFLDRTRITPIASLREGSEAFFPALIDKIIPAGSRLIVRVSDDDGEIDLVFFRGLNFLRRSLQVGRRISVAGTVTLFRELQIAHPDWRELKEGEEPRGGLLPVYPLTEQMQESRLDHGLIQKLVLQTLERHAFSDPFSSEVRTFLDLRPESEVLKVLHAPDSLAQIAPAIREAKIRELWPICRHRELARRNRMGKGMAFPSSPKTSQTEISVRKALSFALTGGQEKSLSQILLGLEKSDQFFGLLQGDVGSGKTAVLLLSAIRVIASGSQAALLAPTEILAEQHFRNLSPVLAQAGIQVALLTSSTSAEDRSNLLKSLADGSIGMVIGTHSLLSPGVDFHDLRFVAVDEQHRFGVEQRFALVAKGHDPHLMLISATPIPRTLAQSLFGDMESIVLEEKPPGRLPVKTRMVPPEKADDLLDFLVREVKTGNQVYWVVPRIDAEGSETGAMAAVESSLRRLRKHHKEWRVEAVHGKMPAANREKILADFRNGKVQALVATTVIEVGVDVPGANLMVVEGAERFGLAQLHQLRGRTGRGKEQAWCFLVTPETGWPPEVEERLRLFAATEDGFRIAEMDLQQRGAGDLQGRDQSGFGALRFSDFIQDADLIRDLGRRAGDWLTENPAMGRE